MKDKKQLVINIFIGILLLAIMVLAVLVGLAGREKTTDSDGTAEQYNGQNTETVEKWQEGDISYNGKIYRYNAAIKTWLFMGIDKDEPVSTAKDGISGGQSDALFLLVENGKTKELSLIAIHRNTMTRLDIYDKSGNYIGRAEGQICLQHAYGDGKRQSCQRSVESISYLFYNLPIHGYFALNMGGVPYLNEAVGGVEVEVMQDLKSASQGVSLKQGETVLLNGDEAYVYLRSRDVDEFDSASKRLERQKQYLTGFISKVKSLVPQGESRLMSIYDAVESYSVSNIDFADLLEHTADYDLEQVAMYSLPGEVVEVGELEEFHLDKDAFYDLIIEVFYEEI